MGMFNATSGFHSKPEGNFWAQFQTPRSVYPKLSAHQTRNFGSPNFQPTAKHLEGNYLLNLNKPNVAKPAANAAPGVGGYKCALTGVQIKPEGNFHCAQAQTRKFQSAQAQVPLKYPYPAWVYTLMYYP